MLENYKICGIISEFNPYHLGHQTLVNQTRQAGATHIIAIMSGNFVQRGEPACFDKWVRTKAALSAGVDLVIELPLPWAIAGAEIFAKGGITLANATGCISQLSFGSECGDITKLKNLANLLLTPDFSVSLQEQLKKGVSFATARQQAAANLTNQETAALLEQPNNILAIAYCKALKDANSSIVPFTIKRVGAAHNDAQPPQGLIASASQIRHMIFINQPFNAYIPKKTCSYLHEALCAKTAPASLHTLETAILAKMRTMTINEFSKLPDVSEGLEHRLYQGSKIASDLESFYRQVKTKRYSHARIRRIVLSALLGVQATHTAIQPPYLHVLGFNQQGKQILKIMKQTASLPIVTQYRQIQNLPLSTRILFDLECTATDLYYLSTPLPQPCGKELTHGIVKI